MLAVESKLTVYKGKTCSFRHDESKREKITQSSSLAPRPQTQNDGKSSSKEKSRGGRSPYGKKYQRPCMDPFFDYWHPPVCQNYISEMGCKFGENCMFRYKEVDSQPHKKSKKSDGKGSVASLKNSRQLG